MKIYCLLENTAADENIKAEHGLSLYIEIQGKTILFDMGQTDLFSDNAEKMGIDLSEVDFAVLSHGHYDHSGGLKKFLEINKKAPVYMSRYAFEPHYNGTEKYIGVDKTLSNSDRIIFTDDIYRINDNMTLYSCNDRDKKYPVNPFGLMIKKDGKFADDDFRHEQYFEITENGKKIIISGCSHKGILNIADWFSPDYLIGGFHFTKFEPQGDGADELEKASKELSKHSTVYYTCHCTGTAQYEFMKKFMGERLNYLSAGAKITI